MAIPSRGIGWSEQSNLLWQISKELERLTCVMAGGCTTTTTTTTSAITNYNVAGCERMEYHVISYTGGDVLPEGTIVNNDTPECWSIIDQTTNPADVGTITYVWPTLNDCTPCIDSHTTTTTTTTTLDCNCYTLINNTNSSSTYNYIDCEGIEINDVPIAIGETINLCASLNSIIFNDGLILDEGVCGAVCNYSCNIYNVSAPADPPGVGWDYSYVDCDGIFKQGSLGSGDRPLTDCMVVGSLTYSPTEGLIVTNLGECLVNTNSTFVDCGIINDCPGVSCAEPFSYFDVWMLQSCIESWPSIGCEVWLYEEKTIPFPNGVYGDGWGGCIVITDGIVTAIP
jgi:hypothetical protein